MLDEFLGYPAPSCAPGKQDVLTRKQEGSDEKEVMRYKSEIEVSVDNMVVRVDGEITGLDPEVPRLSIQRLY